MIGAEYLVRMLRAYGVEYVFGLPAGGQHHFYNAIIDHPEIRHINFHSEWIADAAAIGYAMTSHKPAILDGESTHLATHTLRIYDAYARSIPVIILAFDKDRPGRTFSDYTGNRGIEPKAFFAPITKWRTRCGDIAHLPWCVNRAFAAATTGRPGPVLLEIPKDMCKEEIDIPIIVDKECGKYPAYRLRPNPLRVEEATRLLMTAQKPVIIAGGGVSSSQASDELIETAELLGAPVATTLMAKGQMPETHPLSLGLLSFGIGSTRKFIAEADVTLLVGTRSGWEDTMPVAVGIPEKNQRIVHIDVDPDNIGRNYPHTTGIVADAKLGLQAILRNLKTKLTKRPLKDILVTAEIGEIWKRRRDLVAEAEAKAANQVPISKLRLLKEVRDCLPRNAVIQLAGGNMVYGQYKDLPLYPTNTHLYKGMASGTISLGFACVIGGALAAPNRPSIFFSGDGSLGYSLADLETLARYKLNNVTLIIANDSAWGNTKRNQLKQFKRTISTDFLPVNYANVAESLGCRGIRVEEPNKIKDALKIALNREKPTLIDVVIAGAEEDQTFDTVYTDFFETPK